MSDRISRLIAFLFVIVSMFQADRLAAAQSATTCARTISIEFKGVAQPGDPSYITLPDQSIVIGVNLAIPPLMILVKSRQSSAGTYSLDLDAIGTVEAESEPPGLKLSGASVAVDHGEATFSNLICQTTPAENVTYKIIFTAQIYYDESNSSGITELAISTGDVTFAAVNTANENYLASANFGSYGYFHHASWPQKIPTKSEIPTFQVVPLNIFGHIIPTLDIVITVSCADGTLTPNSFRGLGETAISGLTFNATDPRNLVSTTFYFNVKEYASGREVQFASGAIGPETGGTTGNTILRNYFMRFTADSLFSADNIGNTAVLGVAMPTIEIALYTSRMELDASNTGLIISATCAQTTLVGAEALVVKGVAQFKNLAFSASVAPRSAVITFTAGAQGSLLVNNAKLYSGSVAVTASAIKARHMQILASFSFLQSGVGGYLPLATITKAVSGQPSSATGNFNAAFVIPSIAVEMKDSAFQFDPTVTGVTLDVIFDPAEGLTVLREDSSGNYYSNGQASYQLEVVNGIAAVSNLRVAGASVGQTLSVRIVDSAGIRTTISSGVFTLAASTNTGPSLMTEINSNCKLATSANCQFYLAFAGPDNSYVYAEDVKLDAAVGVSVPNVVVYLLDRFGNKVQQDGSLVPQLVAYTSTTGAIKATDNIDTVEGASIIATTGGANIATWRGDRYVFTCLQFASSPNGLVRVYFSTRDPALTSSYYRAMAGIRSGFFSVTAGPVSRYSISFTEDSFVKYPTMPFSAVVNVTIPPIIIVVKDSSGATDDGANDVVITASANGGTLDSSRARQTSVAGVSTFHMLRFIALSDSPTITFRATLSGKVVDSRTLATGAITLTSRPIGSYELAFGEPYVANPTPKVGASDPAALIEYNAKPLTFTSISAIELDMYISIRHSGHQDEELASENVTFSLTSDQATLSDAGTIYSIGGAYNLSHVRISKLKIAALTRATEPIYVKVKVLSSSSPSIIFNTLFVGPINHPNSAATCAGSNNKPTIVLEIAASADEFAANNESFRSDIAYTMGIEDERVTFSNVRLAKGEDFRTVETWKGVKVNMQFDDPTQTSTNRKTSSELANELVSIDTYCRKKDQAALGFAALALSSVSDNAVTPQLQAAYFLDNDRSCDVAGFRAGIVAGAACNAVGAISTCDCYLDNVISTYGVACTTEPAVESELLEMCRLLSTCRYTDITSVCSDILDSNKKSYWWVWLVIAGAAIFLIGAAIATWWLVVFNGKQKPTLKRDKE